MYALLRGLAVRFSGLARAVLTCGRGLRQLREGAEAMRDGKHVILVVDDDQDVIDGVTMVLEASGYVVESARSGKAGLARYEACDPDFVLVDMMMESMAAGIDLAKQLKARGDKPVFMLTSMADGLAHVADPRSQGLDGLLQKPLDPAALLDILNTRLT
jgi:CheY-like chemotaxis protein